MLGEGIGLSAWWNAPEYKVCGTFTLGAVAST